MNIDQLEKKLLGDARFKKAYLSRDLAFETGQELIKLRILKGVSQKKLAKLIGTKQPGIARIESGKNLPSLRTLEKIADALKVTLEPPRFNTEKLEIERSSHKTSGNKSINVSLPIPRMTVDKFLTQVRSNNSRFCTTLSKEKIIMPIRL